MADKKQTVKIIKPPIQPKKAEAKVEQQTRPPEEKAVATIAASATDGYVNAKIRFMNLPTVSEHLTAEKVQSVFAHLMLMSADELKNLSKRPGISLLEGQIIRLLTRAGRELEPITVDEVDDNGKKIIDPKTGKPKKKLIGLHKDQLQNEKQSLEIVKYLHERAFGKTKITIDHTGIPADPNASHISVAAVLRAMDQLPRHVIDVLAKPVKAKKAK